MGNVICVLINFFDLKFPNLLARGENKLQMSTHQNKVLDKGYIDTRFSLIKFSTVVRLLRCEPRI